MSIMIISHSDIRNANLIWHSLTRCLGYGFVDFESPLAAENAVKNLQTQGVQAQMAKVCSAQLHPPLEWLKLKRRPEPKPERPALPN